ncbi:MAG: serine hydrolase [Pseudomonadota bacterium]
MPAQPAAVPWPTQKWARGRRAALVRQDVRQAVGALFEDLPAPDVTYALLVAHRGELVLERYDHGANPIYLQYSWSMAKSITQALTGCLIDDGVLDLERTLDVPEWRNDERAAITLRHLLEMRSGLEFREDYVDGQQSDVIPMLYEDGRHDTGGYAASKPLVHPPGEHFSYSSGTTNIICRALRDALGGVDDFLRFARERLFEPIGMRSATPRFDRSGTFIGSSFLLADPRDFLRFGLLYLRDGCWDGQQLLPTGWTRYAATESFNDGTEAYGAHWWLEPQGQRYFASGYDGQRIIIDPEADLVLVRLGRTPVERADAIWRATGTILDALAEGG